MFAQPVLKNIPDGTRITTGKKLTRIFICEHSGIFTNTNACIPQHCSEDSINKPPGTTNPPTQHNKASRECRISCIAYKIHHTQQQICLANHGSEDMM